MRARTPVLVLAALLGSGAGWSAAANDPIGRVATLPAPPGAHWVWLGDMLMRRAALFDADAASMRGMLSAGMGIVAPLTSPDRREIYLPETYWSRGTRGVRTDVVTVYDATTLAPTAEIPIPPHRANHASGVAAAALSDDGSLLAVFNLTPASSLSIVDVKAREFVAEIPTPGCSLVYGAGARRFLMLCGDGAALAVVLDGQGRELRKDRSEPFFDPQQDPVTEKAARFRDQWLFVSFDGVVHPVDVGGDRLAFPETWPLVDETDRAASWRVGGTQHLTVHAASGRLYSLVHQGGPDSHKAPGREAWVYDVEKHTRVQRIVLANPLMGWVRYALGLDDRDRMSRWISWLIDEVLPNPGVDRILVTQDAQPVLVTSTTFPSTLGVHDAMSGKFLRDVSETGVAGGMLVAP